MILEYPEMIFKVIRVLLNYGFLRHLSDVKNLVGEIFNFMQIQKLLSTTLLSFINDFFEFNFNYSLNLILKSFKNENLVLKNTKIGYFSNLKNSNNVLKNIKLQSIMEQI